MHSQGNHCKAAGCVRERSRHSVFCDEHHVEQLSQADRSMVKSRPQVPHVFEFSYNGLAVGYFEEPEYPSVPGSYRYEAYRGAGHYEMATALRSGQRPRCVYIRNGQTCTFAVAKGDGVGLLVLSEFAIDGR